MKLANILANLCIFLCSVVQCQLQSIQSLWGHLPCYHILYKRKKSHSRQNVQSGFLDRFREVCFRFLSYKNIQLIIARYKHDCLWHTPACRGIALTSSVLGMEFTGATSFKINVVTSLGYWQSPFNNQDLARLLCLSVAWL